MCCGSEVSTNYIWNELGAKMFPFAASCTRKITLEEKLDLPLHSVQEK